MQVLAIAAGGALGAVLRFWMSSGVYALLGRGFPYGTLHASSLLDVSLDLPVVIEFFDEAGKASEVMEELYAVVGSGHIVSWPVQLTVEQ